jgi:hypothetical protein
MRAACLIIVVVSALLCLLAPITSALPPASGPLAAPQDGELSPEGARVEAWWLASAFRFDEAKELLSSLGEENGKEVDLIAALDEYATSLIALLVKNGKGATFKMRSGDVIKGKPVELHDGALILHNKKLVPLNCLSWESVALLTRSAAKKKGPEVEALNAVAYLLSGSTKVKGALKKCGGPHSATVKKLAKGWKTMAEEFTARALAGQVLSGDVKNFRAAAVKLSTEFGNTDVYARLRQEMHAAVVLLLKEEGKVGGGLNAMEKKDFGRGKVKLTYCFVGAAECDDWELLSFEEATADLHQGMRGRLLNISNRDVEEKGVEVMDIEQRPETKGDDLILHRGAAIRHRLLFKGGIKVTFEVDMTYDGASLPYAIVHGGSDACIHAFYWNYYACKPGGIILEPDDTGITQYSLSGRSVDMLIKLKKTREESEISVSYEGVDLGVVDGEEIEQGYLVLGAIGPCETAITRVIIEGEIVPESLDNLAEVRLLDAADALIP